MNKKWVVPPRETIPPSLAAMAIEHPLLTNILVRRGMRDLPQIQAFLDPDQYTPASPFDLPGMEKMVERLIKAINSDETICVWGDFDVDGVTATTILLTTLRKLGGKALYHIPIRANESHGVHIPALKRLIEEEGIHVLLTCDTGIDAFEATDYAQLHGVDVLISDHHILPETLPNASAIINPHFLPIDHPLTSLPGAGVAYLLAEGLWESSHKPSESNPSQCLDLLALAIVADIVPLTGESRYLLQRGLQALRTTKRPALQAMIKSAEINSLQITEDTISYVLAPRLNAVGRLGDASLLVEFLMTADISKAEEIAQQIEQIDSERKWISDQVFQSAQAQIEKDPKLLNYGALVLFQEQWHLGTLGPVSSRLAEQYRMPVVLLAKPNKEQDLWRGSARSIAGIDIHSALEEQANILERFGGHSQAAGLSIQTDNIAIFRQAFSRSIHRMKGSLLPEPILTIDAIVSLEDINMELARTLNQFSPFGAGNPPPVLMSRFLTVRNHITIGKRGEHCKLTVENEHGTSQNVLWWQGNISELPEEQFDLAFVLRESTYQGQPNLQLTLQDWQISENTIPLLGAIETPFEILDYRREKNPIAIIRRMQNDQGLLIWGEAEDGIPCVGRNALHPDPVLVILTAPPSRDVLMTALEIVNPKKVVLCGLTPETDEMEIFLKKLAGLVKYIIKEKHGEMSWLKLASATAQRESTVRLGLAWLEAHGDISMDGLQDGGIVHTGGQPSPLEATSILKQLKSILTETNAYRNTFLQADANTLLNIPMKV